MRRVNEKLTYANVMATVAVFLALTGVGYAALKLPKNSVGTRQLKPNSVTGEKVAPGSLSAADFSGALGGGTITGVSAGTGLTGGGTSGAVSLGVDPATTQLRVGGSCAGATAVQQVNQGGTVQCSSASAVGDVQSASIPNVNASLINFAGVSGVTPTATSQADATSLSPNVSLVARDFIVRFTSPPGAAETIGVLLHVNATAAALACDVDGPSTEVTCTDPGTFAVPPGSQLVLEAVNGTSVTQDFSVGFRLTPG